MAKHFKETRLFPEPKKINQLFSNLQNATAAVADKLRETASNGIDSTQKLQHRVGVFSEDVEAFLNLAPERLELVSLPMISQLRKVDMIITLVSALLTSAMMVLIKTGWAELLYVLPFLLASLQIYSVIFRSLARKRYFPEFIYISLAAFILMCLRHEAAACVVMILERIVLHGEALVLQKCRVRSEAIRTILPTTAELETPTGTICVRPSELHEGDVFCLKPGEIVPLDGVIIEGSCRLNLMPLTGSEGLISLQEGDYVLSGAVNTDGVLRVKVENAFENSTAYRIAAVAEDPSFIRSAEETLVGRIVSVMHIVLPALAVVIGIVIPVFIGGWAKHLERAAVTLLLGNMSALSVSLYSVYCWAVAGLLQNGVQVRCSGCLSQINKAESMIMDKNGIVTEGKYTVTDVISDVASREDLLSLTATICKYAGLREFAALAHIGVAVPAKVSITEEERGLGICASVGGHTYCIGTGLYFDSKAISRKEPSLRDYTLHVAQDGNYLGCIGLRDKIRSGLYEQLEDMRMNGLKKTAMITEDSMGAARKAGKKLGFELVKAELSLDEKSAAIASTVRDKNPGTTVMYISCDNVEGMETADIGVAFNYRLARVNPDLPDVITYDDEVRRLPLLFKTAKRTAKLCQTAMYATFGVKAVLLVLAATGVLGAIPVAVAESLTAFFALIWAFRGYAVPELEAYESI